MEQNNRIVLFQENQIRRVWHDEKWYFSVVDVIGVLSDSPIPRNYWSDLKRRDKQLHEVCVQLKMPSSDGKNYKTDCANTEGMLRIVMSIPSPNAEPFKLWLAQVGRERIEEIENPELGIERIKELYRAKGYTDAWIDTRMKTIETRKELTDEWKNRDVKEGQEYSILTAEIAKATFGLTPAEHKKFKGLETQNLRDHMTRLELIFTMLGEESTRQIAIEDDSKGFNENREAAQKGGHATGKAKRIYEKTRNVTVLSSENYLKQIEESQKKGELQDGGTTDAEKKH